MKQAFAIFILFCLYLIAQTPSTSISSSAIGNIGVDVCSDHSAIKTFMPVSQAATGPTTLLAGVVGKRWYICFIDLHIVTNGQNNNVNLVEGTGTNCSSVSAGLMGGTTAATGPNLDSSDWLLMGNGSAAVMVTATAGDNVCYVATGATGIAGALTAVNK